MFKSRRKLKKIMFVTCSLLTATFGFSTAYWSYIKTPTEMPKPKRTIASFSDIFYGGTSLIGEEIYSGAQGMVGGTVELIKPLVIRHKLGSFIDELPIKEDVKVRVKAQASSDKMMNQIVPFLLSLKDLYLASDEAAKNNFQNHIQKLYDSNEVPGLKHSLFSFESSSSGSAEGLSFSLDQEMLGKLVEVYDVIFLQGSDYQLGAVPARNMAVVKRTMPVLKDFLELIMHKMGGQGESIGEVLEGVKFMIEEEKRLETLTISLIDFISQMIYKHHQMFEKKLVRSETLKKWMLEELNKGNEGKLFDFLTESLREERYSVQFVVDGLQGHLMEALALGESRDPFLEQIHRDQIEGQKLPLLPESLKKFIKEGPAQSIEFLDYLVQNGLQDQRYLPFFKKLYTQKSSGILKHGISTTPTISVRNLPIAQTGAKVTGEGGTGLPNFHFIERNENRAYYFYGNDSLFLDSLTQKQGMKTIFERLPNINSMNCNAGYDRGAFFSLDGFINLALGEKMRDFGEVLCLAELEKRAKNEKKLQNLKKELYQMKKILTSSSWFDALGKTIQMNRAKGIIAEIAKLQDEAMPKYLLYYNPWPDHFAHFKGPFSNEIISPTGELNRLDYWFGRIERAYQEAGLFDRTLFGMAGDHGLTPVFHFLNPEEAIFQKLENEQGIKFKIEKISSDEGEGPKMNHPIDPPTMKGFDVVVASTAGGNYMMDFFVDQKDQWVRQPLYHELLELKTLEGKTVNIIQSILDSLDETLEFLAVRRTPFSEEGGTLLLLRKEKGEEKMAEITRIKDRIFYKSPRDLLKIQLISPYSRHSQGPEAEALFYHHLDLCLIQAKEEDPATWCDEKTWLELTSFSDNPGSVVELSHLYDSDRAGTVNLFPKQGIGYNTKVPGRHAGEHFHERDAFVGLWGTPLKQDNERPRVGGIGSIPPTLYEYITGEKVESGSEGWGYPSLMKDLFLED